MIDSFRRVGEELLKPLENYSDVEYKKEVLDCLTNEVNKSRYRDNSGKERIIFEQKLIFDLDNNKVYPEIGEEISSQKEYFSLSLMGPRENNIFLSSNNFYYHIKGTIPFLRDFIKENSELKEFLDEISKKFYIDIKVSNNKKVDNKYLLNFENNIVDVKNKYLNEKKKIEELSKSSKKYDNEIEKIDNLLSCFESAKKGETITEKEYKDLLYFLEKYRLKDQLDVFDPTKCNFNVIYFKKDGRVQNILDFENSKYREQYINLCYNKKINDFFEEKGVKGEKIDYLTGKYEEVTNNVSFKTKFFTTTNDIYFENCKGGQNRYKAFSVSKRTFEELLIGSDYVLKNLKFYFKDLHALLIPNSESFFDDVKNNSEIIKNEFDKLKYLDFNSEKDKLKTIDEIRSQLNFRFDLMFYEQDQQSFNIFKIYSSLSLQNIKNIENSMFIVYNINSEEKSPFKINSTLEKTEYLNKVSLNGLWNSLYSYIIKKSGSGNEAKLYRNEFFSYMDFIFNNWEINEKKYIINSMKNLKYGYLNHMKNIFELNNQLLNIFNSLQFFENYNILKYKKMDREEKILTKKTGISKLDEFFDLHKNKFGLDIEKGCEKQGLIIVGYLINKIVYKQEEEKKSKTFLDKINFDGIKPKKIKNLLNDIEEYLKIYDKKIYVENTILNACKERLENIEESSLQPEEITYYVLFGNSLGAYIGIESKKEKKNSNNEPKNEEVNKNDNK